MREKIMPLSQDDIDSIAKAVVEHMDDHIIAVVRTKIQLCLGIDCTKNEDLVKGRRAIEVASELIELKSRIFYGFCGLIAAVVIASTGALANHILSK